MSTNSEENIRSFLHHHKLVHNFEFVITGAKLFGKKRILRKAIKQHKLNNVIYIGDELRDIEAAHACNVKSIAVS